MSDEEPGQQEPTGHPPAVPTPSGSHSRVVLGTETTVGMSMRPPSQFASGGDFGLGHSNMISCFPFPARILSTISKFYSL